MEDRVFLTPCRSKLRGKITLKWCILPLKCLKFVKTIYKQAIIWKNVTLKEESKITPNNSNVTVKSDSSIPEIKAIYVKIVIFVKVTKFEFLYNLHKLYIEKYSNIKINSFIQKHLPSYDILNFINLQLFLSTERLYMCFNMLFWEQYEEPLYFYIIIRRHFKKENTANAVWNHRTDIRTSLQPYRQPWLYIMNF